MPVVPISRGQPTPGRASGPTPAPDEPWVLMAAAQMHAEGRLVKKDDDGK